MLSTAIVDFETSDLDADRGVLLVACIKSSECKQMYTFRIDDLDAATWDLGLRGDDKNIVAMAAEILEAHDVIVAHNGFFFDIPFLRTRMLKHRMHKLSDMKIIDPCNILRRKFRLHSNGLHSIIDHLNLQEKKTPLDLSVWSDAVLNGNRKSMDKIVKHCVQDVKTLDAVFNVVKPYTKMIDDRGSSL